MSYDLINNGISNLMQSLGLQSSKYATLDGVPSSEFGNVFLIAAKSGLNNEKSSETLSDRVYDVQTWEIQIPFQRSNENQQINYDEINRKRDLIIKTLDNPANWESYVRTQKFIDWNVEEKKSYYLLTIRLKIVDTVIY
jgi:hypothetical protein